MLVIPLAAVPSQSLSFAVGGQGVSIAVYYRRYGLFADIFLGGSLLVAGVVCQNLCRLVRSSHLGFVGELTLFDTQGAEDPAWEGLGGRFVLLYLAPGEEGRAA